MVFVKLWTFILQNKYFVTFTDLELNAGSGENILFSLAQVWHEVGVEDCLLAKLAHEVGQVLLQVHRVDRVGSEMKKWNFTLLIRTDSNFFICSTLSLLPWIAALLASPRYKGLQ